MSDKVDVVWSENRDEIFINRLVGDIEKLQQAGFNINTIKKMIGQLDYVRFWSKWPRCAFPVDKLPKGCKWSDGVKYHQSAVRRKGNSETYIFLIVSDDLYIKRGGNAWLVGTKKSERAFVRIINFRSMTANEFLQDFQKLAFGGFFEECVLDFWKKNELPLGWAVPCFRGTEMEEQAKKFMEKHLLKKDEPKKDDVRPEIIEKAEQMTLFDLGMGRR